jgi:hypothetical protein
VRELVDLDPDDHVTVVGVIAKDVIEDLVVVAEPQLAIRALVDGLFHASIVLLIARGQ